MHLGVEGFMPRDLNDVDSHTTQTIRRHGFTGTVCRYLDPLSTPREQVLRLKSVLDAGGVDPCQVVAQHPDLIDPDPEARKEGIRAMQYMCKVTSWLGAGNLYVRPGSINPHGPWFPHPDNHKDETFEVLIDSLKEVCSAAEHEDVMLAVEGHVLSALNTPKRIIDLIAAVDSKKLRFNMDPVNFVGNLKDAYDTASMQKRIYDVLGKYIICGHAKDFFIENKMVFHVEETTIGEGILDQESFLKGFEYYCPDGYIQIEHLPEEKISVARERLYKTGLKCGIEWKRLAL